MRTLCRAVPRYALLLVCVCGATASAQFLTRSEAGGIAIRVEPSHVQDGVPLVFDVVLTNTSGHDLRLPQPQLECVDSITGYIFLRVTFVPAEPSKPPAMHGCAIDSFNRSILERAESWKTLVPGASLHCDLRLQDEVPEAPAPGRYTGRVHAGICQS